MADSLFGTDGIRGLANADLTPSLAFGIARAAANGLRGPILIGRDTRRSGPMLHGALVAGFNSVGLDTVDLGVIPTGGVSRLTRDSGAGMGVVISASHNPAPDNGIKLIGPDGNKLADDEEALIEARYRDGVPRPAPVGAEVGTGSVMTDALDAYVATLVGDRERPFAGMSLVLDCAHGAAYVAAPRLFRELGAMVEVHGASPDGLNINDGCGATHPQYLAPHVAGRVGLCFDGDADRLIAIDEDGVPADGDVIMAILAHHMKAAGTLSGDLVVTTVMANLGFRHAMRDLGVEVVETAVGDRYVMAEMRARGASLGGEQSGHVILEDHLSGDGLRTAVRLADVLAETGSDLRMLRKVMTAFPQVLRNVTVATRAGLESAGAVWEAVASEEERLGDDGRILVRASGTEPLVRVMVEAPTQDIAQGVADRLADVVRASLA